MGLAAAACSVGIGFSSLAITQGKVCPRMGDRKADKKVKGSDDGCFVFCLDATTGKEIWKSKIGNTSSYGYPGPHASPRSMATASMPFTPRASSFV